MAMGGVSDYLAVMLITALFGDRFRCHIVCGRITEHDIQPDKSWLQSLDESEYDIHTTEKAEPDTP